MGTGTVDWSGWAAARGYRMACGEPSLVEEVHAEVDGRVRAGELSDAIFEPFLAPMAYLRGHVEPARVVVIALPRPVFELRLVTPQGEATLLLPPSYGSESGPPRRLASELQALVGPRYRVALLRAPLKAIAVRLGLAQYGRNNLAFVEGLGTGVQLVGLVTDAPLEPVTRSAASPSPLARCERCLACAKACPASAIAEDRFLIHAERCVALRLERAGTLPAGLAVPARACLLGCLECQVSCPKNRGLLRTELRAELDAEETRALLDGRADERLTARLRDLELADYGAELLARNLRWALPAIAARAGTR